MPKSGTAKLPLHNGSAPRWLFDRMESLGREISRAVIDEHGQEELLKRLSDPYWFQSFGCVLGFDWHSSGLTTTTMGALKEALELEEHGIKVAGGKGSTSRKTPEEIEETECLKTSNIESLKQVSRTSAAVDNNCLQDSYELYHHTVVFTEQGDWCVVQQGMNSSHARRYHWFSGTADNYVEEPQEAICAMEKRTEALNLSSTDSGETRQVSLDLVKDDPRHLKRYVNGQTSLDNFRELEMPDHHWLRSSDITERSIEQLRNAYELQPENFEQLVNVEGVGRKSLRALAMIAELVHGSENDWNDPAKYSYAHGGKDGTPHPVNRERYDNSIETLKRTLDSSGAEKREKEKALKRLEKLKVKM